METQIEKLYKMRLNPAHPMADGSDHAIRLPPEILIRTFCLIPDDALACIKTCKTFKDPAINVHWTKFNNQRFKNLLDMNDKKIKVSYMTHVRDLASSSLNTGMIYPIGTPALPLSPRRDTTMLAPAGMEKASTSVISSRQSLGVWNSLDSTPDTSFWLSVKSLAWRLHGSNL